RDAYGRAILRLGEDTSRKQNVEAIAAASPLCKHGVGLSTAHLEHLRNLEAHGLLEGGEQRRRVHEVRDESSSQKIEDGVLYLRMLFDDGVECALVDPQRDERRFGSHIGLPLPFGEKERLAEHLPFLQANPSSSGQRHPCASRDDRVESKRALIAHDD